MAVGDLRVFQISGATHNAVAINSVTHASVQKATTLMTDPGPAGSPGPADERVTDRDLTVTLYGLDPSELQGLVEDAAANLVLSYKGEGGANKTATYKNVAFNGPVQAIEFAAKDAGGKVSMHQITGRAHWGAADTWALMEVFA